MTTKLLALISGRPLPSGKFLVLIFVRGGVDPRGHRAAGRIRKIDKVKDLVDN
jgi:hypothetical protein